MPKQIKHQEKGKKQVPVIVFVSIVRDVQGRFTLSLMPVSYLEKRYDFQRRHPESCKLPN